MLAEGRYSVKKILLSFALLLAAASNIAAQAETTRYYTAFAYEDITVGTGTAVLNVANAKEAQLITYTVGCASGTTCVLKFTVNGTTTPSTTVGLQALYGDTVSIYNTDNIRNWKGTRGTATDVLINVQYFR